MPWQKSRPNTTGRGYGTDHARARARYLAAHQPTDPCCICGRPLGPAGPGLHLDHTPDRQGYRGLAHARCNRSDGARRGRARQNATTLRW